MCNCIEMLDKQLDDPARNTLLDTALNISNPLMPPVMMKIAVVKRDTRRRTKPVNLLATYCPVCGEKYGV